jgi:HK97 family phage prohead protease
LSRSLRELSKKTLRDGSPVFARFNHDDSLLLGTTESGTLTLQADKTGLRYEVDLPDTSAGRDVQALAKRGDLRYSSFAFQTLEDSWDLTAEGFPLRTLLAVKLVDVAPVTNPAYRDTTTGMRSLAGHLRLRFEDVREAADAGDLRPLFRGDVTKRVSDPDADAQLAMLRRRLDLMAD